MKGFIQMRTSNPEMEPPRAGPSPRRYMHTIHTNQLIKIICSSARLWQRSINGVFCVGWKVEMCAGGKFCFSMSVDNRVQ